MTLERCCSVCRGSSPHFICRDKRCICHLEQDLLAQKKYRAGGHKDPTANQAIGNVMKGIKNDRRRSEQ